MAKYKVVAYEARRYEVEVEAGSEDGAKIQAEKIPPCDWEDDCEYYKFGIESIEKIEKS